MAGREVVPKIAAGHLGYRAHARHTGRGCADQSVRHTPPQPPTDARTPLSSVSTTATPSSPAGARTENSAPGPVLFAPTRARTPAQLHAGAPMHFSLPPSVSAPCHTQHTRTHTHLYLGFPRPAPSCCSLPSRVPGNGAVWQAPDSGRPGLPDPQAPGASFPSPLARRGADLAANRQRPAAHWSPGCRWPCKRVRSGGCASWTGPGCQSPSAHFPRTPATYVTQLRSARLPACLVLQEDEVRRAENTAEAARRARGYPGREKERNLLAEAWRVK